MAALIDREGESPSSFVWSAIVEIVMGLATFQVKGLARRRLVAVGRLDVRPHTARPPRRRWPPPCRFHGASGRVDLQAARQAVGGK